MRAGSDAQPLTPEQSARMRRYSFVKDTRLQLGLSQADFAAAFHIPLGTLRDWEQGAAEPDSCAKTYLTVIARNPKAVEEALAG